MVYRHETVNLLTPLKAEERRRQMRIFEQAFPSYHMFFVNDDSGIAVESGPKKYYGNTRYVTVYPKLGVAVMGQVSPPFDREQDFISGNLQRFGYRIAGEKTEQLYRLLGKLDSEALTIACKETGCLRTNEIFGNVLRTVNAAIKHRKDSTCYFVSFEPPGDEEVEIERDEYFETDIFMNHIALYPLPIKNGEIDAEELAEIFFHLRPNHDLGISSETGSHEQPMIDFRCDNPEEAIHTIERLGINPEHGALVDSGASFHYYGSDIISGEEAQRFLDELGRHEEVCDKWPPLQKRQGFSLLRVTPCIRKPKVPVILGD